MLRIPETKTMTDEAYSKIKQMLYQGKLTPSQRLVYKDLANILQMSQTPIISALNRLEEQGFLVATAYRGFYVRPIDVDETRQLFELRIALESYIVEQAIIIMTDDNLKKLEEKIRIHSEYRPHHYDARKLFVDADVHLELANFIDNNEIYKTLARSFEHIILRYPAGLHGPERISAAIDEHLELLKIISSRNIQQSVEFLRSHIRKGRDFLIDGIKKREQETWPMNNLAEQNSVI